MNKKKERLLKEYELLARFAGYIHIPFTEKGQFASGWFWDYVLFPQEDFSESEIAMIRKHNKIKRICGKTLDLLFKYDFNRLMRIVDKIEENGATVTIKGNSCHIKDKGYDKTIITGKKISSVYDCCVDYVKYWFNTHNVNL